MSTLGYLWPYVFRASKGWGWGWGWRWEGTGLKGRQSVKMKQVGYFESPVGVYEVIADNYGVTSIKLIGPTSVAVKYWKEGGKDEHASSLSSQHINDCITWLDAYFSNSPFLERVKLPALSTQDHENKPFCLKVWQILKDRVKVGETVTYGELAKMAGNPKAARAVGMAMKSNPISIIVPCHRVVKSGGEIGNYSSFNGVDTKKWLLQHEGGKCHWVTDGICTGWWGCRPFEKCFFSLQGTFQNFKRL